MKNKTNKSFDAAAKAYKTATELEYKKLDESKSVNHHAELDKRIRKIEEQMERFYIPRIEAMRKALINHNSVMFRVCERLNRLESERDKKGIEWDRVFSVLMIVALSGILIIAFAHLTKGLFQ